MAVYLFTFHAYRSWMPDHPRGHVQRKKGILPSDPAMARHYDHRARFEHVRFSAEDCRLLLGIGAQECARPSQGWRLHAGVAVFNHVHLLVSWPVFFSADRAKAVLHRALNVALRDVHGAPNGRPFLSRGGSRKRVCDRGHFNHLCHRYLPSHRKYGGILYEPADGDGPPAT